MSNLLGKPLLTTAEVAAVFDTNESTIRESRVSGKLYGRPAPKFRKFGPRKIMYQPDVIKAFIESMPQARITDEPEPEGPKKKREDEEE